jgi:hypothetical protein
MRRLVAGVLLSLALAAPAYAADDGKPKGAPEAGYGGLAPRTESEWTARSFLPLVAGAVKSATQRALERGIPTPLAEEPLRARGRRPDDPLGGMGPFERGVALRPAPEAPSKTGCSARYKPGDENP